MPVTEPSVKPTFIEFAGEYVNVNTVPVDPTTFEKVPFDIFILDQFNWGHVVVWLNVIVNVVVNPTNAYPEIVMPCVPMGVLDATIDPDVMELIPENVKDVDVVVAGFHTNVNTDPDPLILVIVPLTVDVNATVGSVVPSVNVAVMTESVATLAVPVSVSACATSPVFVHTTVPDAPSVPAPATLDIVNDVDVAVDGVQRNVNTRPVDPVILPIVPLDADVNAMVGSVVMSTKVAVIVDAYPTHPCPVMVPPCALNAPVAAVYVAVPPVHTTFMNVKDVFVIAAGLHVNVNDVPGDDPSRPPITPLG